MDKLGSSRISISIAFACLFFAFAIGIAQLKSDPIGNDEFNSLSHLYSYSFDQTHNIAQTVESVAQRSQQHGPLYFVLLNIWQKLAGEDLFSARLLSAYFGLLAIVMTYRLAMLTHNQNLAIVSVVLVSFLSYFAYYFHIARMYTLLPLLAGWVAWSYWQVSHTEGYRRVWKWLSLFISVAAILYVHYFGIMILAAIGFYHLLFVKKNKLWWQLSLVLIAAGLMFLPWLPVALEGFTDRINLSSTRLPPLESLWTVLSIFSNSLAVLPLLAVAIILFHYRRLNRAEKFLLLITGTAILLAVIVNEFTPILVERRMRYTTVFALPFCCTLAIGLRLLPGGNIFRLAVIILWIASFFAFAASEDLSIYTNKKSQGLDKVPHYQDFLYESHNLPGYNELILSFHPDTPILVNKILQYYRKALEKWAHIVHIAYDQGELEIQSTYSTWATLDAIADNSNGIWVIHDPQQTNLSALPAYTDWFTKYFKACKRYLNKVNSVIEYYLKLEFPCALITDPAPIAIHYQDGTQLANFKIERTSEEITIYLWWTQTIGKAYSLSLQIFDQQANKVRWLDAVIEGEPLDLFSFDISTLAPGDYVVKLIVYNYETLKSQSGTILAQQQHFDREVELLHFTIND